MEITSRVTLSSIRSSMRRAQYTQRPPLPHSLAELNAILLNPQYRNLLSSIDGEDNLHAGMAGNCLVISSARLLSVLSESDTVFLDCTYFSVPVDVGAVQLLTVVVIRDHHVSTHRGRFPLSFFSTL